MAVENSTVQSKAVRQQRRALVRAYIEAHREQVYQAARLAGGLLPGHKFCVLYRKDRTEHQTPWFSSRSRAHAAREIMQRRYGAAAVYVD